MKVVGVLQGVQLKGEIQRQVRKQGACRGAMAEDNTGATDLCEEAAPAAGTACCCRAVIQLEHQASLRNSNKGTHR